ncbi:hypothetical protein DIPPA_13106 [Diplonema papillatum]|nr:hypothetical protein DIPPA_13106 [Diplonema papillatum]
MLALDAPSEGAAKRAPGRIKVHDAGLFVEVAQAGMVCSPPKGGKKRAVVTFGTDKEGREARRENAHVRRQIREASNKAKTDQIRKDIEKRNRLRIEQQESDFHRRLESIVVENEHIMTETAEYLDTAGDRERRKKERLYQDWHRAVFSPLQTAISEKVDGESSPAVGARRREQFEAYLRETNAKGAVFRDIIVESSYDPLGFRKQNTKRVPFTADDQDPTHQATLTLNDDPLPQLSASRSPKNSTGKSKTKAGTTGSRATLEVTLWDKVEATPHGRYSNKETKPPAERTFKFGKTGDFLDHYAKPLPAPQHKELLCRESGSKGKSIPPFSPVRQCAAPVLS